MQPLCLTFDNGPEPKVTPGVLATLARRGIPATFFLIGEKLRDPARLALASPHAGGGLRGRQPHAQATARRSAAVAGAEAVAEIAGLRRAARRAAGARAAVPPERRRRGRWAASAEPRGGAAPAGGRPYRGAVERHPARLRRPGRLARPRPCPACGRHRTGADGAARPAERRDAPARPGARHLAGRGRRVLAEPPEACVPIRRGVAMPGLAECVAAELAA